MVLSQQRTLSIFSSNQEAKQALNLLRAANFPMAQVSLISQAPIQSQRIRDKEVMNELVNQARQGAITGSVSGLVTGNKLGSVAGMLLGIGTLAIPGVGQLILAGSAGTIITFAFSSGAIGAVAGGLIGSLIGLGVTEAQVKRQRQQEPKLGNYLLLVEGSDREIKFAESILNAAKTNGNGRNR